MQRFTLFSRHYLYVRQTTGNYSLNISNIILLIFLFHSDTLPPYIKPP